MPKRIIEFSFLKFIIMFTGLNQKEFNLAFQTEDHCRQFLYDIKWEKGFCCRRCGNTEHWKGRTEFHARCRRCDYDESVTANTVFHKVQIPLLKAFSIAFHVTAFKKGVSCRNLSKIIGVGLKTVWLFKRKVQKAMGAWLPTEQQKILQVKHCSIDGIILTHREKPLNGLQQVKLTIQKLGSGTSHISIRCINSDIVSSEMNPCTLVAGRYVNEGKDLLVWNFRAWLTGTHHHCSNKYLQGYLDEHCFRFNHRGKEDCIWHTLISQMMWANPTLYKQSGA